MKFRAIVLLTAVLTNCVNLFATDADADLDFNSAIKPVTSYIIDQSNELSDWKTAEHAFSELRFRNLAPQSSNLGYHSQSIWAAV